MDYLNKKEAEKKEGKLISVTEAALQVGVHSNTLRRWDNNGILKAVTISPKEDRYYRVEDLNKRWPVDK